jgi:uncharacterized membrane protein YczE
MSTKLRTYAANLRTRLPAIHDRPARRLANLYAGLVVFGLSIALLVRAGLGLSPWDVFHQGVAARSGLPIGTVVIVTGATVLLLWLPLRQRPGLGTVSNVIVVACPSTSPCSSCPSPEASWCSWSCSVSG